MYVLVIQKLLLNNIDFCTVCVVIGPPSDLKCGLNIFIDIVFYDSDISRRFYRLNYGVLRVLLEKVMTYSVLLLITVFYDSDISRRFYRLNYGVLRV